jgi:hypothetical protein
MRRILVSLLIFLFSLQVFADSLDCQLLPHASVTERLSLSDAAMHSDDPAAEAVTSLSWDDSEELPAGADLSDSLVIDAHIQPADCPPCTVPGYVSLPRHLLFLPVIKPPPVV